MTLWTVGGVMEKKTETFNFRIGEEEKENLRLLSEAFNRSKAGTLRQLINIAAYQLGNSSTVIEINFSNLQVRRR